jgi:hypothetical protein
VSVQLLEAGINGAFGAADAAIAAKAGVGPGGIPWSAYLEGAGLALGFFGGGLGVGSDIRDPVLMSALTMAGYRATKLQMAGKLFKPKEWAGVGGDGSSWDFGGQTLYPQFPPMLGAGGGRLGRGGYPVSTTGAEPPGIAG